MPKKSMQVWGPKSGRAAEWRFTPSAAIRKSYPQAPAGGRNGPSGRGSHAAGSDLGRN